MQGTTTEPTPRAVRIRTNKVGDVLHLVAGKNRTDDTDNYVKDMVYSTFYVGNFVTVVVHSANGGVVVGTAKRNPTDKSNRSLGFRIALNRAYLMVRQRLIFPWAGATVVHNNHRAR